MTKRTLRRWTKYVVLAYVLMFVAGVVIRIAFPDEPNSPVTNPVYGTFKDMTPFLTVIPAAWLREGEVLRRQASGPARHAPDLGLDAPITSSGVRPGDTGQSSQSYSRQAGMPGGQTQGRNVDRPGFARRRALAPQALPNQSL